MGILNIFKPKTFKEKLNEKSRSNLNDVADEYLKNNLLEHKKLTEMAEKISRADIIKKQTKQLKEMINKGLDEEEEEEEEEDDEGEEEEEEEDDEDPFMKGLLNRFGPAIYEKLTGHSVPTGLIAAASSGNDGGSELSPIKQKAFDMIKGMSDEEIEKIAKRFFK